MRGVGCPHCNNSHGEEKIYRYLKDGGFNFESEFRFDDCKNEKHLPFDFYIIELNTCIEFQGIQHYQVVEKFGGIKGFEKRIKNDNIKRNYCDSNNIKLIEIKYTDYDNIENILDRELK